MATKKKRCAARGFDINERYSKKTDLEHVLLRPDTYVGGTDKVERESYVWDDTRQPPGIVRRKISYSPALLKIFDEIAVNARDHSVRDNGCTKIKFTVDAETGTISVENNGAGIPVEMHEQGCYLPELIFGQFKSGENFRDDEKKVVGGRNGLGATLCVAFSRRFEVDTVDKITSKRYVQVWEDNMSTQHDPVITTCQKAPYTKVSYIADFERLGGTHGLEPDFVALLKRRVYDMAASTRKEVLIYFNGEKLAVRTFERYMGLYLGDNKSTMPRVYTELTNETPGVPAWELGVSLSDDGFKQVSFVNGIATTEGGTHVAYIRDQLVRKIGRMIRDKTPNSPAVKPEYIRENLMLFINATVVNPAFSSQTKESLTTKPENFGFKHNINTELIELLERRLKISRRAIGFAEMRKPSALKAAAGGRKTKKITGLLKLEDATLAGTRRGAECTLILTEGDSAKTMAMDGLQIIGRERYGVFPLKGKAINARNASDDQLAKNEEFLAVMKIMGLQPGVEYANASELRYGSILLLTDQDLDGFHIKGLVINNIISRWPSLLKIPGFIKCFVTPIVKLQPTNARSRKKEQLFFNMSEFEAYRQANPDAMRGMRVRYLKGLGTSQSKEARAYFADFARFVKEYRPRDTTLATCIQMFEHAFSKTCADWRKEWLSEYDADHVFDYSQRTFDMEDYVDCELKHFSIYDNQRSLGSVIDGLKISQRKVLWAMMKLNQWTEEKKVLALSGEISSLSSYHHGETSLMDTAIGMAQTFVDSNNVNLLFPSGQFGSRLKSGKDASDARYIYTRLNEITGYLFRAEDAPVLQYEVDDEGKQIEPRHFVPIVPHVLINGCNGIGTGYSTDVLKYDPLHVIDATVALARGEPIDDDPAPWYRNFRGTIEKSKTGYNSIGTWARIDDTTVSVTEIPVGHSYHGYKAFIEAHLIENAPNTTTATGKKKAMDKHKYFIKEYESRTFPTRCDFRITFASKEALDAMIADPTKGILKRLKLTNSHSTQNMHLFTETGAIRKFASVGDIMRHHAHVRLELYGKRKQHQLNDMQQRIDALNRKSRFIQLVINGVIETRNRPKSEIALALREHGLVPDDEAPTDDDDTTTTTTLTASMRALLSISLLQMTQEEVAKFLRQIEQLREQRDVLEQTSPEQIWLSELQELRAKMVEFMAQSESEANEIEQQAGTKKKKRATKAAKKKKAN